MVPFGANNSANPPRHEPKTLPDDPLAPINFLFVGANWQRKGGEDCARAVKILRSAQFNAHLSIVGACPYPNGINSDFIHQYEFLRPNIPEERTRLQWLHQEAHFFILPSHADCTPIVFAEAASYGLPVISRDVGGVSSMVSRDQNSILIQRDDGPDALAQAIRPLLTDANRYRSMSLASLQLSANCLNWETAVERVTNILEHFLPR